MSNLQLSLKTKWFEMTKAVIKTEDYREITPYWMSRLLMWNEEKLSINWIKKNFYDFKNENDLKENIETFCQFKEFTTNTMTLGYPKSGDTERIIKFEHAGIEIREGNPDWGAEPVKLYFVIKHGKQI